MEGFFVDGAFHLSCLSPLHPILLSPSFWLRHFLALDEADIFFARMTFVLFVAQLLQRLVSNGADVLVMPPDTVWPSLFPIALPVCVRLLA